MIFRFLLLLLFFPPLFASTPPSFGLITIPKSGAHLIMKCLHFLQPRTPQVLRRELGFLKLNKFPVEGRRLKLMKKIESLLDDSHYAWDHAHLSSLIKNYLKLHPDFRLIVGVRDLRAALVSQVYYRFEDIEKYIGPSDMEQKLAFLMSPSEPRGNIANMTRHAKAILTLSSLPNVLVVRFEDLVGAKGGGDDGIQRETIIKIASHIRVPLSREKLDEIQSTLFGNEGISSATFRTGMIESWRNDFNPKLHEVFNANCGEIQLLLGYSLDE